MTDYDTPTESDRIKFYLSNSLDLVGHCDTLETVADTGSKDAALEKLEREFHEGVSRVMRNKREHGFHPVDAFEFAIKESYPVWLVRGIAESEYNTFEGDPDFMTEKEEEYLEHLEEVYEVPE